MVSEQSSDPLTPEMRSWVMSRVKGKDTYPERRLEQKLREVGLKFERHSPELPGKPDFVFRRERIAVFVDGCFWHGCAEHCRMPKARPNYWPKKIVGNKERAQAQGRHLKKEGWSVLRFWEHEVTGDLSNCIRRVKISLSRRRKLNTRTVRRGAAS